QGCFPFFIVIHPSAGCEFSYPLPQLVHGFLVYPHSPSLCALVKPVSEKLDSPGIGCHCFLSVYFEEQLLFNERDDVFQRLHRTCLALAEDHHIVRISYELMPSSLQLMIQLVQHDIRTQRAKWTSL